MAERYCGFYMLTAVILKIWIIALEGNRQVYNFRDYLQAIRAELTPEGYTVELKLSDQKIVHSAFVRFPGLLYDLGLSAHQSDVLAVKLGVDANPSSGAGLATTVIKHHCYQASCMRSCKGHIPRGVTSMICSGV